MSKDGSTVPRRFRSTPLRGATSCAWQILAAPQFRSRPSVREVKGPRGYPTRALLAGYFRRSNGNLREQAFPTGGARLKPADARCSHGSLPERQESLPRWSSPCRTYNSCSMSPGLTPHGRPKRPTRVNNHHSSRYAFEGSNREAASLLSARCGRSGACFPIAAGRNSISSPITNP